MNCDNQAVPLSLNLSDMFSTTCYYGLQAMLYIASHTEDGKHIELNQIVEDENIPKHFLSKILQMLVKSKLLTSMKGPHGGYLLSRPSSEIKIIEIIEAIDGLDVFKKCGVIYGNCKPESPCPVHDTFRKDMNHIQDLFTETKLTTIKQIRKKKKNNINNKYGAEHSA